jgi:hypothetical protein
MVVIDRRRGRHGLLHRIGGRDRSHPERALDPADDTANRAADHGTDRASGLVTDLSTMCGAVGNALRLRRERASKGSGDTGRDYDMELHAEPLCFTQTPHVMGRTRPLRGNRVAQRGGEK